MTKHDQVSVLCRTVLPALWNRNRRPSIQINGLDLKTQRLQVSSTSTVRIPSFPTSPDPGGVPGSTDNLKILAPKYDLWPKCSDTKATVRNMTVVVKKFNQETIDSNSSNKKNNENQNRYVSNVVGTRLNGLRPNPFETTWSQREMDQIHNAGIKLRKNRQ
ncbi:hypothetical protein U1Q18_023702 [Sarracenia purpurea var. burkii]